MKPKIIIILLINFAFIQILPMDHHHKSTSFKKFCFTHALTLAAGALGNTWFKLNKNHAKLSNNTKHLFALKCYLGDLAKKEENEENRVMRYNYGIRQRKHPEIHTNLAITNDIEISITAQLKLPTYYQTMLTQSLTNLKTHVTQNGGCLHCFNNQQCAHINKAVDVVEKISKEIVDHNAEKISKIRSQKKQIQQIAFGVAGAGAVIGLYSWLKS
jgi:Na+-transporting NADH:ubiquinone oxidoreductase subunit NqrC